MLYTENNWIRVRSHIEMSSPHEFGDCSGDDLPIQARSERAERFTRHAMEISIVQEEGGLQGQWGQDSFIDCFVIAGDDLPKLCQALLVMEKCPKQGLDQLTLAIKLYIDEDGATVVRLPEGEIPVKGETPIKDETLINDVTSFQGEISSVRRKPSEETTVFQNEVANLTQPRRSNRPSPRVLRLLEPLHRLHSLQNVHIVGPINEEYKKDLLCKMHGPPPSDHDMFDILLAKFEDAMNTHETGDQSAALDKMKMTLDIMKEQNTIRGLEHDLSAVVLTGKYVGYSIWSAQQDIQREIEIQFAWAELKIGDIEHTWKAGDYVDNIIGLMHEPGSYWNSPPMGHKAAVAFYLEACFWDSLDRLGNHDDDRRSDCLEELVRTLREGLRHEPDNALLEEMLMRRVDELEKTKETEDLMTMWDRLNEKE